MLAPGSIGWHHAQDDAISNSKNPPRLSQYRQRFSLFAWPAIEDPDHMCATSNAHGRRALNGPRGAVSNDRIKIAAITSGSAVAWQRQSPLG